MYTGDEAQHDPRRALARREAAERRANMTPPDLVVASLGWGVQSTTLAVLAALRDPRLLAVVERLPDAWLHADTTHERQDTYNYAEQLTPWLFAHGVRVHVVQSKRAGTLVHRSSKSDGSYTLIPAHSVDDATGKHGMIKRQCTSDWKIAPQDKWENAYLRQRKIQKRPGVIHKWLGISIDEYQRARWAAPTDSRVLVYPLLEMGFTRGDCIDYLESVSVPVPPKSSCVFCPYHNKAAWQDLKRRGGRDWSHAVAADAAIRETRRNATAIRRPGSLYVHPARVPLQDAVTLPEEIGQLSLWDMAEDESTEAGCTSGHCFL
jgi:hypothetical protein